MVSTRSAHVRALRRTSAEKSLMEDRKMEICGFSYKMSGISMFGWRAGWLVPIWVRTLTDGKQATPPHRRRVKVNLNVLAEAEIQKKKIFFNITLAAATKWQIHGANLMFWNFTDHLRTVEQTEASCGCKTVCVCVWVPLRCLLLWTGSSQGHQGRRADPEIRCTFYLC